MRDEILDLLGLLTFFAGLYCTIIIHHYLNLKLY